MNKLCAHVNCKGHDGFANVCHNSINRPHDAEECPVYMRLIREKSMECQQCFNIEVTEDFKLSCEIHNCFYHFANWGTE